MDHVSISPTLSPYLVNYVALYECIRSYSLPLCLFLATSGNPTAALPTDHYHGMRLGHAVPAYGHGQEAPMCADG